MNYLTTAEVAARLSVTIRRAQSLVAAHPNAKRFGRSWMFPAEKLPDLEGRDRKRGRRWPATESR